MAQVNIIHSFSKIVDTVDLIDIISQIKSDRYKNDIQSIRKYITSGDKDKADSLKKKLPGFTPCGTFKDKRAAKHLAHYNNIIIVDIDSLDAEQVEPLRAKINEHPYTYVSFISPSGLGLKILVKVSTGVEDHKDTFTKVNNLYSHYLGIETDPSGKDVCRLCFVSYDPGAHFNPDADVFAPASEVALSDTKRTLEEIDLFTQQKLQYQKGQRNNFIHLLACNCNREGRSEAETLSYISTHYADLPIEEVQASISSAYANISEHNTNKKKSKSKKESKSSGRKSPSQYLLQIENFLRSTYDLRFNIVTKRIEYKKCKDKEYKLIDDYIENTMLRQLNQANISVSASKLRSTLNSTFVEKYDPFILYYDTLPAPDSTRDYIKDLADTVTTSEQELWHMCFKKWLVAMVASLAEPKIINHTVIVFTGSQGIGKTTWMENLVPRPLKNYLYSGSINPNNKDTLIHLSECMLINLDELENLNRSEIGALKEVITKSQIRMRRAYGHNQEHMPRRASFAGSVNTSQFLNDATGSRRFLCFEVANIAYQHDIDIDDVMAQAYQLYKDGFQFWFDTDEIKMINANNEKYQIRNISEELLLTYFRQPVEGDAVSYYSASDMLSYINVRSGINTNQGNVIALGKALSKHGFTRVKKNNRYVYEVVTITDMDVNIDKNLEPETSDNPSDASFDEVPF